ncbi:MAG: hypothetical protein MPJ50_06995 [Pirellulales bacterium]|nr:hypothetical protein [Pirellulales bacterium]
MAIKSMLSKLSHFSLRSKVGLAASAVILGVLSWSIASWYFSGDDGEGRRRPPKADSTQAANAKQGGEGNSNSADGDNQASDAQSNKRDLTSGSQLLSSLNHSTGSRQDSSPKGSDGISERYADNSMGSTEDRYGRYANENQSNDGGSPAGSQLATSSNQQSNRPTEQNGDGSLLDRYRPQARGDRYADYRSEDGSQADQADGAATGASSTGTLEETDPFARTRSTLSGERTPSLPSTSESSRSTIPGYATRGSTTGTELPRLDRSTNPLDQNSPAATTIDSAEAPAFRSPSSSWIDKSPALAERNDVVGLNTTQSGRELYPSRPVGHVARTVPAGGNRRMEPVNSTRPDVGKNQPQETQPQEATPARTNFGGARLVPLGPSSDKQTAEADREFVAGHEDSFWTIAKKAYGEGGYFEALHAYNSQTIARIDGLRVGDIVRAPAAGVLRQLYPGKCPPDAKLGVTPATTVTNAALPSDAEGEVQQAVLNDADNSRVMHAGATGESGFSKGVAFSSYVTREGDDLFRIAREQLGTAARWAEVYEINKDVLGDQIDEFKAGVELRLPKRR